tara:strand:- start:50 stop:187 length:138 start_codon:yes stop_codon:yes gene_type:complete
MDVHSSIFRVMLAPVLKSAMRTETLAGIIWLANPAVDLAVMKLGS